MKAWMAPSQGILSKEIASKQQRETNNNVPCALAMQMMKICDVPFEWNE
jgi:hypothetical protein